MKKLLILSISFFTICFQSISSQEVNQYEEIVARTFEAVDKGNPAELMTFLSEDFTIAGYSGEIARKILHRLVSQIGETIKDYKEKKRTENENVVELVYSVEFEKMGRKESVFTFNREHQLIGLELFKMEVKVLEEGETKINMPSKKIIEIPFEKARGLVVIKALLNGRERKFLLDTGSPRVVLNSKYGLPEDIKHETISSTKDVNGSNISGMNIKKIENLDFGGIELNDQKVVTMDLTHLEESLKMDLSGIIGYELIKDYDIVFDYENLILTLIDPEFFETYREDHLKEMSFIKAPLKMRGHIPVLEVQIGTGLFNFGVDSGAESNLIDNNLFSSLKEHLSKIHVDNLIGGGRNSAQVKNGVLEKMSINNKHFQDLNTVFTDITHLNKDKEREIQGLIGYPILSRQRTIISFRREEILLEIK
ncbi:retroviral-like aspartic protease family protein [Salegentibacter sp. F188]|uniref:Retroviral-like aspartic protease family protein n=1 Tax=Autumnicola patrickiae TaxID=3075591 RepID=A0ABU3E5I5_9FLAO|nr:retroviral-like aspartic protease family protein [Salegentibacter sp. F188]MDT0691202.1 retroviral-like aspartic protease family protein [Salegentibacter sp. F188]